MTMTQFLKPILAALAVHAATGAQADAPDGEALYATYCAACHGADLEGAPDWQRPGPDGLLPAPPHDETGHTWHHGDRFLFDYVKLGGQQVLDDLGVRFTSAMPAFDGILTDMEIEAILDFIRASWPERIRDIQAARTAMETDEQ
ncbi:MAG: cytochrome c [Rhodobacteraceae bacterium]|nr:cytochrome c [Paracoccaceae bacterium]